jgi:hypothetical protein
MNTYEVITRAYGDVLSEAKRFEAHGFFITIDSELVLEVVTRPSTFFGDEVRESVAAFSHGSWHSIRLVEDEE